MKKLLYILIVVLVFATPKVFALDATITDLSCTKKTGGVESELNATVNELNITVDDVVFEDAGDFMKCTFKINNTSDDDLEIDSEVISNKSDEKITYSLTSNKGNIVKKGESNTYNLEIKYIEEYSESKTIDNNIEISLVGDKINVPDTLVKGFALIMVIVLLIGACVILLTKRKAKYLVLLAVLLLIPSAYALTKVSIKMSNKIIVDTTPKYDLIYDFDSDPYSYSFLTEEEALNYVNAEKVPFANDDEGNPLYEVTFLESDPETLYYYYRFTGYKEIHKFGETVAVKDIYYRVAIDCNQFEEDGIYGRVCESIDSRRVLENEIEYWWYYESNTDEEGDFNFSGDGMYSTDSDEWEGVTAYVINFGLPKTFVMPNHSTTFTLRWPKPF